MRLNNKGFTLVEVLAVVVILALLASIAIPNVLSTINTAKETSYKLMVSNIVNGSQTLYEEVYYGDVGLFHYKEDGTKSTNLIHTTNNTITINLQTLVSNGFVDGNNSCSTNDSSCTDSSKALINPDTKEKIGYCQIKIVKTNNNGKVSYNVSDLTEDGICPSSDDYKKEVK